LTGKHAVKRCLKYIEFAGPTDDRSMLIPTSGWRIAHADRILHMILNAAVRVTHGIGNGRRFN
jgi:hypothetical protein